MASSPKDPIPVEELTYEQARDELAGIVGTLESGGLTLEESLALWERGEALAAHCRTWLDAARTRIADTVDDGESDDESDEDE